MHRCRQPFYSILPNAHFITFRSICVIEVYICYFIRFKSSSPIANSFSTAHSALASSYMNKFYRKLIISYSSILAGAYMPFYILFEVAQRYFTRSSNQKVQCGMVVVRAETLNFNNEFFIWNFRHEKIMVYELDM